MLLQADQACKSSSKFQTGRMLGNSCVFSDLSRGGRIIFATDAASCCPGSTVASNFVGPKKKLQLTQHSYEFSSVRFTAPLAPHLFRLRLCSRHFRFSVWTKAIPSSPGENEGDGDKDVQELLVDLLRLETGKIRVNEFVEDRSKFLTEIAQQANEEYDKIAEEARKSMDEAGSKVLEQIDAEAAGFEEELAAARAEIEANERDLNEFEKNVEQARSEGLFFKSLFAKPTKPWKDRSPEEQKEIKEKAKVVKQELYQVTKKAAASKFRRAAYGVMIILLTLTVLEAVSSGDVQWTKLTVYMVFLVALVLQLTYETVVSRDTRK